MNIKGFGGAQQLVFSKAVIKCVRTKHFSALVQQSVPLIFQPVISTLLAMRDICANSNFNIISGERKVCKKIIFSGEREGYILLRHDYNVENVSWISQKAEPPAGS